MESRAPTNYLLMGPQVTPESATYADAHTTPRSPDVAGIAEETLRVAAVQQMMGGAVEGRLLESFIVATRARRVLEIGTFTGATTLTLAEALPAGGIVITVEFDEGLAEIARRQFERSSAGARIDLRVGDAREVVRTLDGPFEVVFIDAWKQHYVDYYEAIVPLLADHGVLVADNVVWGGLPFHPHAHDDETDGVRRFVEHVQADSRTHNALLTVGDGLLVAWGA